VPNRSSCIPFFCEAQHHCRARCTQPWRPRDVEAARLQGTWRGCQCNMRGADEEQWCTVLCSKLKYPFDARSRQTDSTFFLGEFHAAVLVEPLCFLVPAAYSDSVVWKKTRMLISYDGGYVYLFFIVLHHVSYHQTITIHAAFSALCIPVIESLFLEIDPACPVFIGHHQ
jgi:hypothetical protein